MPDVTDYAKLFARIDRSLERATGLSASEIFNLPATESEVSAAEAEMGVRLPVDVRQAYLWHNGRNIPVNPWDDDSVFRVPPLVPGFYDWLPLSRVLEEWRSLREFEMERRNDPGDPIHLEEHDGVIFGDPCRSFPLDTRWVTVAEGGAGTRAHIDLYPSPWGVPGQLVRHSYDGHTVIAISFVECLSQVADALDAGRYQQGTSGDWVSRRTSRPPWCLAELR